MINCLTDAAFPENCVEKIQTKGYDAIVRKSLTAMVPIVSLIWWLKHYNMPVGSHLWCLEIFCISLKIHQASNWWDENHLCTFARTSLLMDIDLEALINYYWLIIHQCNDASTIIWLFLHSGPWSSSPQYVQTPFTVIMIKYPLPYCVKVIINKPCWMMEISPLWTPLQLWDPKKGIAKNLCIDE